MGIQRGQKKAPDYQELDYTQYECWAPTMGPLEKQQELLTTEAHIPRPETSTFNLVFKTAHFKCNV